MWHFDILPSVYKYVLHLSLCSMVHTPPTITHLSMPSFLKKLGLGSPEVSEGIAIDEIQSSGTSSPKGEKGEKDVGTSSAHELSEAEAARRLKSQFLSIAFDGFMLIAFTSLQAQRRCTLGPQSRE